MARNNLLMTVAEIDGGRSMRSVASLLLVILAGAVFLGVILAKSDLLNPITNQALIRNMEWEHAERQAKLDLERQRQQLELEAYALRLQRNQAIWETSLYMFLIVAAACLVALTIAAIYRIVAGAPNWVTPSQPVQISPQNLPPLLLRHPAHNGVNGYYNGQTENPRKPALQNVRKSAQGYAVMDPQNWTLPEEKR